MRNFIIFFMISVTALAPFMAAGARQETKPFTVVIDPGHGGKDVGATDNNVKEKDINLGVALALAEKIKKGMKNVKVVMTRDNDTFISLQQRADKANKAKADLFISIHTNSVDVSNKNRKNVAGSSVYALGLHKDGNNMAVARRENSVIELEKNHEQTYKGFDPNSDESYIIFEMAQKKNLSQSIKFANEVQRQLVETAGRADRKVHQAGFWVLWATCMPAVLIELDFICNPNSAVYMASDKGQKQLAQAIFNAVRNYRHSLAKATASELLSPAPENVHNSMEEGMAILLPASKAPGRNVSAPPVSQNSKVQSRRRRRSAASREMSDKRNVETASITIKTHSSFVASGDMSAQGPVEKEKVNIEEVVKPERHDRSVVVASGTEPTSKKNHITRIYNNREVIVEQPGSLKKKMSDGERDLITQSRPTNKEGGDRKIDKTVESEKSISSIKHKVKESADAGSRLNRSSLRGRKK